MRTSDSPQSWSTTVSPQFNSTFGTDPDSVSSVPIVKSTRRRTILEVVIQLKGVRPAYHTTSSGSGTSFGDVAEDQATTKGQARKEGRSRDADDDKDYDGDVEVNEDEMYHNDDDCQISRYQTGLAVASPSNERCHSKNKGGHVAQSSESEITAVHRAESMDLDLDSPSSCVTSSSSDSEDDDLCSIDDTDLTDDLERSDKLELDGDDGNSEFGRVSQVSCSVDESSDEDEVYLKRFRSSAPSPPALVIRSIFHPLAHALGIQSPTVKTLNSNIKVEDGESKAVMDGMISSQAKSSPYKSQMATPCGTSSSTASSQQTVDAPKARKYARLRLEVSLPHPSLRKMIASARKGTTTRTNEGSSQPCPVDMGNDSPKQGWNDGWPGQWHAGNSVAIASNLDIAVEGLRLDTLKRNGEVSQNECASLEEEGKDGLDVPMEVNRYRLSLNPPTLPTLPSDNRHTCPIAQTADVRKHHEHLSPPASSLSSINPSSPLDAESICAISTIQTDSSSSPRLLASQSSSSNNKEVNEAAPNCNRESGEFDDANHQRNVIEQTEYGRGSKRKLGSFIDNNMDDKDGKLMGVYGNDLKYASSSRQTRKYDQALSRPAYGMRERSLEGERGHLLVAAESNRQTGALEEVNVKDEDVKMDVKDEDVKMEDETDIKWKGKGKEIVASGSSSIEGRASSLGVRVVVRETALRPKEEMGLEGNEEIDRYFDVAAISSGTPGRVVIPAVASTTGNIAQNVLPGDKVESRNVKKDRREGEASTRTSNPVNPRMPTTLQQNHPPQRKVGPPTAGSMRIDSFLARNDYDARGRLIIEPQRNEQKRNLVAPDLVLAYPPRTIVGHLPSLDDIDNIYIYLQLAPLVPSGLRLNDVDGAFFHGNDLWNRILHPNMKQVLSDQNVVYPAMNINPYPPEAVFIRFQIDQWRTQALVASYKACILGGSESDNQAMKSLLNRSIGGQLPLDYSLSLLQVLASKLDAIGRMGMGDEVSPCRIMSTNCLERGYMDTVTTTAEFDGLLRHCSASPSTEIMAGWFICHGKVSTYSYTFKNRSLRVYSTGRVIGPRFHGYVQVLLDSLTNILDLPEYDIDVELLHLAPLAQPQEEGPIAIAILELLLLDKIPHRCLLDIQTTEDRLAAWIPQLRLQQAQYLLDDHAAFKLLDRRLRALRRMMDDHAQ